MNINAVSGGNTQAGQAGAARAVDSVSKNIQRQIADIQKKMQELSSNQDMSMEEKMQKRQDMQKQIYDLQNQLRQHEIQQRREVQQARSGGMEDMLGGKREAKEQKDTVGISEAGMKAMISADSSMDLAQAQGKAATQLRGKAKTLSGEMKLDRQPSEEKQEEIADLEAKAMSAEAAQGRSLGDAVKEMEAAAAEEAGKADGENTEDQDKREDTENPVTAQIETAEETAMEGYKTVDVLL